MASADNIRHFDIICGFIFGKLYLSFPLEIEIKEEDTVSEEYKLKLNHELIFSETMHWLKKEGFISFYSEKRTNGQNERIANEFFSKTVLTNKSLIVLKNYNYGDKLIDAIQNEQNGIIREIINLILVNKS